MYRSAALTTIALAVAVTQAVAEPTLPAAIEEATFRPTTQPATENLVQEAALHVTEPEDLEPLRPRLDARLAMAPKLVARVDISDQVMRVLVEGEVVHEWAVSTAGKGYKTPTGVWKPYRMHTMWHSRKYNNAPMPHSIFYDGGYAIHATPHVKRLGSPASHGCVRLHPDNAKELFRLAKLYGRDNMRVVIDN